MSGFKCFKSKRVVLENVIEEAGIVVDVGGKISNILIGKALENVQFDKVIDVGNLVIMAGVIDAHVHISEPGRTEWEGYETGTKAAAAGGITTIVDMPLNSIPFTTTLENFQTKLKATKGKVYVDVAFWGGLTPDNKNELKPMIEAGVIGFKCFLCRSGDGFPHVNFENVEMALKELQGTNAVVAFHAELDENIAENGDPKKYETFLKSRPPSMEVNAIKGIASLCQKHSVKCHIVHLSAAEAIPIIRDTKRKCNLLSVETCPHYLTFDSDSIPDKQTQYKCCPPIRNSNNKEKLWEALINKDIDIITSDHSPCTQDFRTEDFMKSWAGIGGVQLSLSTFWTEARKRNISLIELSRLMSANTAKICDLQNFKGKISVGMDADFVIWDPDSSFVLEKSMIQFKNKMTPYIGMELFGKVHNTVLRGETIYSVNKGFETPYGKLLTSRVFN